MNLNVTCIFLLLNTLLISEADKWSAWHKPAFCKHSTWSPPPSCLHRSRPGGRWDWHGPSSPRSGDAALDLVTNHGSGDSSSRSSNRILMSCQPHRVTSGQSNSGHKQIHVSKLFSHTYQPSVKSIYTINHFTNIKHKHQTPIFKELVPSILPLLKEHIRLGHAGIVDHSI